MGGFNYKDIYCEMKQLIRHILREHTREIGEIKKTTTPEFIEKAKAVHGNKYDYSKVDYQGNSKKIEIICPKHGPFLQVPAAHIRLGQGCPKCAAEKISSLKLGTLDKFLRDAKKVHGNTYDYSKVDYKGNQEKVEIICPIHGSFLQSPNNHISKGRGCPKCKGGVRSNTEDFINKSKEIHGNKYDYSLVDYKNNSDYVKIICPTHGVFSQSPASHLRGRGCPDCGMESKIEKLVRKDSDFIERANQVHNNKYDYSDVDYRNALTKVEIICSIHGPFLQTPGSHLAGNGCPICRESKGEMLVQEILEKNSIESIRQKIFLDCTNKLKGKSCKKLPFDFYLPKINAIIEYDGQQHYIPVWGEETFKNLQRLDKIRNQYCKKNGIKLIRIPYTMNKEEIEPYILKELGI